MSLRDFHIVFIISSILLGLGFSYWALQAGFWITAFISCVIAIGLILYSIQFAKKVRA